MCIFYFSQAEIAQRKIQRKQAEGKKAEIIPDSGFRLINKDRDELKYPQMGATTLSSIKTKIFVFGIS